MGTAASVDGEYNDGMNEEQMREYMEQAGDEAYFDEDDFGKLANDEGKITKETLMQLTSKTDCFLTHDWGEDEQGRNNHERVTRVNAALKQNGLVPWFDSERMNGNIMAQMCGGIDNASCIVVFITERYVQKVGGDNAADNCKKEFNYAERRKTGAKMIAVVMEPRMRDPTKWNGPVGMVLGGNLYIDLADDHAFDDGVNKLIAAIRTMVKPING